MLERFASAFKRFYADEARITSITEGAGYSDRGKRAETELAVINADLQSMSGELANRIYGVTEECQARMFSEPNEHIKAGNYVEANGRVYRIVYVAPWTASEALLRFEFLSADAPYPLVIGANIPLGADMPLVRKADEND